MTNIIIIYILNILLVLPLLIVRASALNYSMRFQRTIGYVQHVLGWIIGINGPIRTGKTSLLSGLSSISQIIIMNEIQSLLTRTIKIFKRVDFNHFNSYLDELFSDQEENIDFELITDVMLEIFKLDGEKLHYTMIGNIKVRKLITDYIFAYYCLHVRNNFVQSKTPFYSHITYNYNLELNTRWLGIREAYKNKDYAILDYMVILIDETTDEAGAMAYLDDIKDEAGGKEYRRKFGQIHQERNRIITTKQDVMDEVKKYRNLTHSNLVIDQKVRVVGHHPIIYKVAEFITKLPLLFLYIFKIYPRLIGRNILFLMTFGRIQRHSKHDLITYYFQKTGLKRNIENKLYYYKNFFTSTGYNHYYGYILKRAEDIDKITADREEFSFYIPTIYCFGTYDTHYYKEMQKELLDNSQTVATESNPFIKNPFFSQDDVASTSQEGDDKFEF